MKPTQITELLANIRKTIVSFFSILMFVALGVGIFLGISWSGPALQNAAESQLEEGSMHHFQIQYVYGLTDDDLVKLAGVEGVSDVEATRQSFQSLVGDDGASRTVKVQTLTERIDVPVVLEGALPTASDEIALNAVSAKQYGYGVGDTITFVKDGGSDAVALALTSAAADGSASGTAPADKDGMKYLNGSAYKVTGLVKSAEYIARESETYGFSTMPSGSVNMLAWVPASSFDAAAFQNGWPVVDVVCDDLRGVNTFGDDFKSKSRDIEARITDLGDTLGTARYDDLHGQAKAKIDEGEQQLAEGKQKVADGERQLEDGRAELETKRAEGEAKLAQGYEQLQYFESLRQQGEAELAQGRALVAEGEKMIGAVDDMKAAFKSILADYRAKGKAERKKYNESKKTAKDKEAYHAALDKLGVSIKVELETLLGEVEIDIPVIDHENYFEAIDEAQGLLDEMENVEVTYQGMTMTIAQARKKLAEGREMLAAGEAEYNTRIAQLEEGWAAYYSGQEELARLVAEGEQKIADGEAQLEDAKKQIAEKEPALEAAKSQFESMKSSPWAVMSRLYNAGVAEVSVFSGVTTNLSFSMAALFIIVGLLVSYSAVSRIVHEQITQIGTKKALGLRSREITLSFLLYSGIAVIVGAVVGTIVGILAVEGIIGHVLGGMFTFGDYPPYVGFGLFLVVTLLELVLILGATWLACRGILREHAVELLKGEKPPTGKTRFFEKWAIWDRLPLFTQTIVNNCLNDKRRVFSTVVGVAGCTALIVTALTLNDNVMESYDVHYNDVYGFDAIAFVDSNVDGAVGNVKKALESEGAETVAAMRRNFILSQGDDGRGTVRVVVPDSAEDFERLYHVRSVSGGTFDLAGDGAWVSLAYRDHYGAKVGDKIRISDTSGGSHEVPILGFYEFWLTYHEVVMGKEYYESEFGTPATPNVVLANTGGAKVGDLGDKLANVEGFSSITDDKTHQYGNFKTFSSVSSAVVLIYMALSILMAVVVLLNLNVMFISEKKRELIVLMINGFSVKHAKRYIYNDTIVLTAIGIVFGIVLGCIMGAATVNAIEPSTASFVTSVDALAVVVGIVGSAVLSFIMSKIALMRIPRFELTDINRF